LPGPANRYHDAPTMERVAITGAFPGIRRCQLSLQVEKRERGHAGRAASDRSKQAYVALLEAFLERSEIRGCVAAAARVTQSHRSPGMPESHIQYTDVLQHRRRPASVICEK